MENEIVIRNLPADFYVPDLCNEFINFRNIVSACVQAGEACVTFEDGFSALEAVRRMNEKRVRGRTIEVITSFENQRFEKVFVKNLSSSWEEPELVRAFEQFGPIKKVQIFGSSGKSNGYGCVEFKSHTAAKRAITAMNGTEIGGHRLVVERFKSKAERDHLELNSLEHIKQRLRDSTQKDNLVVQNLPSDMEETELTRLFQRFGDVVSVKVDRDKKGKSKGFGYVSFEREKDAARAQKKMDGHPLRGDKILKVHFKEDGKLRELYKRRMEQKTVHHQYKARSKSSASLLVPSSVGRNMAEWKLRGNF